MRILVVEDEAAIANFVRQGLTEAGHAVDVAWNGRHGLDYALAADYDVLILDIMLPGMSGLEILKKLRDAGRTTPVLVLTARGEEPDRVLGLELGADDYLTKPFSVRELLARIRSLLRRAGEAPGRPSPARFRFGDIEVDFKRQKATRGGRDLDLSAREFRILSYFIEHRGEMLSREQLLNDIWGYEVFPTTRTVDNHIARLRKKVELVPDEPRHVITVHGIGYRFESKEIAP